MSLIFFHIDVNSAFLSWSAIKTKTDHFDLRTIPSIIGGDQNTRHGIVLAASIPAKKFGIQTGEPIANAFKKCPNLVIESPDMAFYKMCSQKTMSLLSDICPKIEQVSIDECFMDYTFIQNEFSSPLDAAAFIKNKVRDELGFTVNIGISDIKVFAKMASDFQKPDKVHTLYRSERNTKLWPLPIEKLYMCGKSSAATLRKLGITSIGELATFNQDLIISHLKSHGLLLYQYANGIDDNITDTSEKTYKGIGNSTTLTADATSFDDIKPILRTLSQSVALRLRKSEQLAGMISIEIKYHDFSKTSHQTTLLEPTNTEQKIYQTACSLFCELWDRSPVRLLGIRTSKLIPVSAPIQLSLFPDKEDEKQQKLEQALHSIKTKFGTSSVIRGSELKYPDHID